MRRGLQRLEIDGIPTDLDFIDARTLSFKPHRGAGRNISTTIEGWKPTGM
jgi:hypothetical protein